MGEKGAGDLCLLAFKWMTSVFSGANGTQMAVPRATRESNAAVSLREFCSYDGEATVREKSSTYERRKDLPSGACRGGYIDDKEERGALWDSYRHWDREARGAWIDSSDGPIR